MWPDLTRDSVPGEKQPTEHQFEQIQIATSGQVGLLTGGPGVGKSFSTAWLIKAVQKRHPGDIGVICPTGKAAVRITECMKEYNVDLTASTIHTTLQPMRHGHDSDGWNFFYGKKNRLPYEHIFIDESSMIDSNLMASLLEAVEDDTKLLFVGDPYQLPPVGHGRPLHDFIDAGLPHGHFTDVHRFAGRIARVCNAVQSGAAWEPSESIDLKAESPENYLHIEAFAGLIQIKLWSAIEQLRQKVDPFRDIQVICPVNKSSTISRDIINQFLQSKLNPHGESRGKFRIGDKCINRKNGLFKDADGHDKIYISNGEIGVIKSFEKASVLIVKFSDSKIVRFHKKSQEKLELAYAITGHSSQGSQWPVVIVIADDSPAANMVAVRAWWYTTLSRSSRLCISIGKMATIKQQCQKLNIEKRRTFLPELIRGEMELELTTK